MDIVLYTEHQKKLAFIFVHLAYFSVVTSDQREYGRHLCDWTSDTNSEESLV